MGIAPLLIAARRFLQLNFVLIKQYPLQVYDLARVWVPEKSLMRERYSTVLRDTPRVLFGLPQSWEPVLHVIQHHSWVNSVAFSPDGGQLASGSDEIVRIWNTATGELENELEGHTKGVWSVGFSHNGHFIVSGSGDKTVRIWNMATCETRYTLTGHTSRVTSVAISRDDKFVVSGSNDQTVRIWDTAMGGLLHELKGHADKVVSVAVSPDCQHIASGSDRGEVWIGTKDGVIKHKLKCPTNQFNNVVSDLAFSHDGHRILCNVNRTEWTITGRCLSLPGTDNDLFLENIHSVAYSPIDREIVYGMEFGRVMIWNMDTKNRHILGIHSDGAQVVTSISFSPDGSRMASGSDDKTVRIWDPRTSPETDLGWLGHVALSHDGQCIVTASRYIQVWRVAETMTKANKLSIKTIVSSIALSHDGSHVVIGCTDGSILVWNHLTNMIKHHKSGHSNPAWSVIWNQLTKRQIRGHSNHVTCVAFSYDGSHVMSVLFDRTVRIWNCHTGKEVGLYQHSDQVTCVAFSRDGGRVAFGDYHHKVWIWNPSTGDIRGLPDDSVRGWISVAFSHDGNHVISGRKDEVWIWNVMTNESTKLSERIQLPDGTRVHSLSNGNFHIYDPVDQETTNGLPPYLLSISPDRDWITGEQAEHSCWIPPQYRDFTKAHIAGSIVCLRTCYDMIVLDLKRTPHAERIMPGV